METFLLFLYTAIVSVLIALLLGKLFADDTADHDAAVSAQGSAEVQNVSGAVAKDEAAVECEESIEAVLRCEDRVAEDDVLREGLFHHLEKFSRDRTEKVVEDGEHGEKVEAVLHHEEKVVEDVLGDEIFRHPKKFSGDAAEKVVKDEAVPEDVVEVVKGGDVLRDDLFRHLEKFGRDEEEEVAIDEAVPEDAVLQREVEVVKDEAVVDHVLLREEERVVDGDGAVGVVLDDKEVVLKGELTANVAVSERSVEGDEKVKKEENFKGEGSLLQGEDGWEGIERSEVEKLFAVAVEYVGGEKGADEVSKLSSDVQMKLYGLHKVATEGPCYESQPMALKVASRAKWNAWQRLGSMNPEAAMELYVSLLSDSIPEWKRETPRKDGLDSLAVRLPGNEASDSRLSEDSSDAEGGTDHGTAGSKFKQGLTTAMLFNLISPSRVAWLTLW